MVNSQSYSKNVDLWALGVIVHQLLTSEIPFLESLQTVDSMMTVDLMQDSSYHSMQSAVMINTDLLYSFCRGQPFPITAM